MKTTTRRAIDPLGHPLIDIALHLLLVKPDVEAQLAEALGDP
jgi:hypothetical protein